MRYNVHSPCTFHNRIAKYLGVLVGAALVATLGLPSAVQAQTPAAPTVSRRGNGVAGSDAATITATWGAPLGSMPTDQDAVAARIYRAWRRMGQSDGEGDNRWSNDDFRCTPRE